MRQKYGFRWQVRRSNAEGIPQRCRYAARRCSPGESSLAEADFDGGEACAPGRISLFTKATIFPMKAALPINAASKTWSRIVPEPGSMYPRGRNAFIARPCAFAINLLPRKSVSRAANVVTKRLSISKSRPRRQHRFRSNHGTPLTWHSPATPEAVNVFGLSHRFQYYRARLFAWLNIVW